MAEILVSQVRLHDSFIETIRLVIEGFDGKVDNHSDAHVAEVIAEAVLDSWRVSEREETA